MLENVRHHFIAEAAQERGRLASFQRKSLPAQQSPRKDATQKDKAMGDSGVTRDANALLSSPSCPEGVMLLRDDVEKEHSTMKWLQEHSHLPEVAALQQQIAAWNNKLTKQEIRTLGGQQKIRLRRGGETTVANMLSLIHI